MYHITNYINSLRLKFKLPLYGRERWVENVFDLREHMQYPVLLTRTSKICSFIFAHFAQYFIWKRGHICWVKIWKLCGGMSCSRSRREQQGAETERTYSERRTHARDYDDYEKEKSYSYLWWRQSENSVVRWTFSNFSRTKL